MKMIYNIAIAVIALVALYFVVFFDHTHQVCPAVRVLLTVGGIAVLWADAIWFLVNNGIAEQTTNK